MRIPLLLSLLLVGNVALSQHVLDSLVKYKNRWEPNVQRYEFVYRIYWDDMLQYDTVKLRPGQYFKIAIDGSDLTWYMNEVTGRGNGRISHHKWWYPGYYVDTLGNWIDTTYSDTVSLPYTEFGLADICGNMPYGPSDSLHKGGAYSLAWLYTKDVLKQEEYLTNNDFDSVIEPWYFNDEGGNVSFWWDYDYPQMQCARFQVDSLNVERSPYFADFWESSLHPMPMIEYELTFRARAEKPGQMRFHLLGYIPTQDLNVNLSGDYIYDLTTEWADYSYQFSVNEPPDSIANYAAVFYITSYEQHDLPNNYYFDEIRLHKLEPTIPAVDTVAKELIVRPVTISGFEGTTMVWLHVALTDFPLMLYQDVDLLEPVRYPTLPFEVPHIGTPLDVTPTPVVDTTVAQFPIDFYSSPSQFPQEKSVRVWWEKAESDSGSEVYVQIDGYDFDFPNEGALWMGEQRVDFPGSYFYAIYDQEYNTVVYKMPTNWWVHGWNTLTFQHLKTQGYRIDTVKVLHAP